MPELEAMRNVLNGEVAGPAIASAEICIPVSIHRPTSDEFIAILTGNHLEETERRGKYLQNRLDSGHLLAVHLMLTGCLQLAEPSKRSASVLGGS